MWKLASLDSMYGQLCSIQLMSRVASYWMEVGGLLTWKGCNLESLSRNLTNEDNQGPVGWQRSLNEMDAGICLADFGSVGIWEWEADFTMSRLNGEIRPGLFNSLTRHVYTRWRGSRNLCLVREFDSERRSIREWRRGYGGHTVICRYSPSLGFQPLH